MKKQETLFLLFALVLSFCLSLFSGAGDQSAFSFLSQLLSNEESTKLIFIELRLPRTLACTLCGSILAWAGVCAQGLFRNPMAEPSLLGVNAGAMVFLLLGQLLGALFPLFSQLSVLAAFLGAVFSLFVLWVFSKKGKSNTLTLILLGICLNAFLGAIVTVSFVLLPSQALKNLFFWSVGDCSMVQWKQIFPMLLILPFLAWQSQKHSRSLDVFSLGDDEAVLSGIEVEKLQKLLIVCIALCVSVCLNAVGNIGFIALLAPHIIRFWKGPNHSQLMIYSPLIGAIWMNMADFLSKSVMNNTQLPIGVFIVGTGVPLFLWLVMKNQRYRLL